VRNSWWALGLLAALSLGGLAVVEAMARGAAGGGYLRTGYRLRLAGGLLVGMILVLPVAIRLDMRYYLRRRRRRWALPAADGQT